jgi:surfeit locus 1 family protein
MRMRLQEAQNASPATAAPIAILLRRQSALPCSSVQARRFAEADVEIFTQKVQVRLPPAAATSDGLGATDRSYAEDVAKARFLLRPRWLLSHLFVVVLVVTMVNLGLWQLRRLDEKRDRNALIEARSEQPVTPVGELLDPVDDHAAVEAVRHRTVTATGTYDDDETVAVRNRTQDGVAGAWLVTPLRLEGGERVGVIRGFVGMAADGSVVDAQPPAGEVTVTGLVVDPDGLDGTAPRDVDPLLAAGDGILPALVRADESDPPEPNAADPTRPEPASILPVPPPELSEGPHLGYAVQWFIFSAIAVIGYPLVLRRVVARRGREVDDCDDLDRELDELLRQGG